MKRLIVTLALATLLSGSVLAGGLTLGFVGGLNFANVAGDSVEDNTTKLCLGGGGFLDIPLSDLISIQPQVLFMMKGFEFENWDEAGVRMSYIDIPVLARVSIPMAGPVTPCLFAGPYLAFNLSAESYFNDVKYDLKDEVKSTDYGLVIGGGFDYNLLVGQLILDARYVLGLTSIDDTSDADDVKNTGIMIMAGYGFSL